VEIREEGVDEQGGLAGDRQWIVYKEGDRERLLIDLAKTVGAWARGVEVNLQLLPQEFQDEVRPLLTVPGFRADYTVLEGSRESAPMPVDVRPIKGGLFIRAGGLSRDALIRVCVEVRGKRWCSDYESLDSVGIRLNPQ
jgi:hypothetical protein